MGFKIGDLFNPKRAIEREAKKAAAKYLETARLHPQDKTNLEMDVYELMTQERYTAATLSDRSLMLVEFVWGRAINTVAARWRREAEGG